MLDAGNRNLILSQRRIQRLFLDLALTVDVKRRMNGPHNGFCIINNTRDLRG